MGNGGSGESVAKTAGQVLTEAQYKRAGWRLPNEPSRLFAMNEDFAQAVIAWHEAHGRPAWPPMRPMSEPPTEERPEAYELLFLRADGEFELGPGPQFGVEYLGWWPLPEVPR